MLIDGLIIMVLGMGVVFTFLLIMVMAMHISAFILNKMIKPEETESKNQVNFERVINQNDDIAVVIAAVRAFTKG